MSAPLLSLRDLRTTFHTAAGAVPAVAGVSFDVAQGEIMGLVGESGGGKSVVGYSILGLIDPPGAIEGGQVLFDGRDLTRLSEREMRRVRGRQIAMVFQDPMTSLNPVQTVGAQMDEMLRLHTDLTVRERRARAVAMLESVGISRAEERLAAYPHEFSGGMRQRVVIAIALLAGPRLIIADEPTTALDVTIQAQILELMRRQVRDQGASLILITHDLAVVAETADSVSVLYAGRVVESGPARAVIDAPAHPYTRGLVDSIPDPANPQTRLRQIRGTVPDLRALPTGCAFAGRCPRVAERCLTERPPLAPVRSAQSAACHFPLSPGEAT
ncbi:ABC transporter ATP-binding protein [Paracoccus suum]|uniref:ABC transporter ATP-binding protein n=1 Tax=Paracoccus suum TaxID=2259340 RepID=A0A344PMI6_9RHOB|nr:ABC transporter ATP-binding protein [Paracoccus suum]AXC50591.1 ABC transporter ATP-binding protein [Paracoccus suum]